MDQSNKIVCPDCQSEIKVAELVVGSILECGECGTEVEIIGLDPLKYRELLEEK